jgi:restriction system protein
MLVVQRSNLRPTIKNRSAIAVGTVQAKYEYHDDLGEGVHQSRGVKWIAKELPRTSFGQDLLYSFGAFMIVCQITRNNAEKRVIDITNGKKETLTQVATEAREADPSDVGQTGDIEEVAADQIQEIISRRFRGQKLSELVDAILTAKGYTTLYSRPGPDGGVEYLGRKRSDGLRSASSLCPSQVI